MALVEHTPLLVIKAGLDVPDTLAPPFQHVCIESNFLSHNTIQPPTLPRLNVILSQNDGLTQLQLLLSNR